MHTVAHCEQSVQDPPRSRRVRDHRRARRLLLVVGLIQVIYAAVYIQRSSFVVEGQRYFCLFDDAMISMRYGANWAAGHGLVWNIGERVEGYTNFGWTMVMGLCHLLPLSPAHQCLLIQVLGALTWSGMLPATALLARACRAPPMVAAIAAVLTVSQWNLIFFSLNGMESGLLTLLVTLGLRGVVLSLRRRAGRVLPFGWFALAMLVRPDTLLVLVFATGILLLFAQRRWRTIAGLGMVVAVVAVHVYWRRSYYGDWLPNTYYLKATGWPLTLRLQAGMATAVWTLAALGLPALLGLLRIFKMRTWHALLIGSFLLMFVYGVYVGGDAWPKHYRFVLPTTPGLMIWAALGVAQAVRRVHSASARNAARWTALAILALAINSVHLNYWVLRRPPYGTLANRSSVRYALAAERIADPSATAAVGWAGAFPYFSKRRCVDLLGKCDAYIARTPVHGDVNRAGHNKFDTDYMLATHHPDIVVDRLSDMPERFYRRYHSALIVMESVDMVLAVRRDSRLIGDVETIPWERARAVFLATRRD